MKSKRIYRMRIVIIVLCLFCISHELQALANAEEKPLVIKGISLDMDIYEARMVMDKLLSKDWVVSSVGKSDNLLTDYRFGDELIFGNGKDKLSIVGKKGFFIKNRSDYYAAFVSADEKSNKINRISFSGKFSDELFSTSKISADDFVDAFRDYYNLPEFNWIAYGWIYSSRKYNYTLTIKIDKFIDVKKEQAPNKIKINFN